MAHLNLSFDFDSESELTSGNGWRVVWWLDDGSGTPPSLNESFYATITDAQTYVQDLFSADPEVDKFFYDKAVADYVATAPSETAITTSHAALRTAEGLDAAVPEPPTLTTVAPATGGAAGGTAVTLTGTDFTGATGAIFGDLAATAFTVVSATSITCTTPAHAVGVVDVVVLHPVGDVIMTGGFTYT
jgi:hypothetical protein